jgi:hypothetical protein
MIRLDNALLLLSVLAGRADSLIPLYPTSDSSSMLSNTLKDNDVGNAPLRVEFKSEILQLGASYDRGFGASTRVRNMVSGVIAELESLNFEKNASRCIAGLVTSTDGYDNGTSETDLSPLTGTWRMVWTTANDVLSLGASPLTTVGAIYQIFEPPIVTNVIDLLPRIQNLLPPSMVQNSMLRIKVQTRGSSRANKPMRVGLDFEKVSLNPIDLLGQDVSNTLPPFKFDLPRILQITDDAGFFDVTYLDGDMLVIRQNSPGGVFVLVRVRDSDP